ncbi:MAG: Hsp20/alpha crystallin family protein [Anaerolineae bacterium]|nr:Hsp20/alpha crystallin family protein [Anaerolineae bacterium]
MQHVKIKNLGSRSLFGKAAQRLMRFSQRIPCYVGQVLGHVEGVDFYPPVDVYVTLEEVVVQVPVPGLSSNDIEIAFADSVLLIEGATKSPPRNVRYLLQEQPRGHFSRTLTLTVPVDAARADAWVENGLLLIVFPKGKS